MLVFLEKPSTPEISSQGVSHFQLMRFRDTIFTHYSKNVPFPRRVGKGTRIALLSPGDKELEEQTFVAQLSVKQFMGTPCGSPFRWSRRDTR